MKVTGYKADPRSGVRLTTDENASCEFALQRSAVRWNEISTFQGESLFPPSKGKDILAGSTGGSGN